MTSPVVVSDQQPRIELRSLRSPDARMTTMAATDRQPCSPYQHPNLPFMTASQLLLGSIGDLRVPSWSESNTSRSSFESTRTVHGIVPHRLVSESISSVALSTARSHSALDNISDLALSTEELHGAVPKIDEATSTGLDTSSKGAAGKAIATSQVTSVFDWQDENDQDDDQEEEQDSICPLQRQPRVDRSSRWARKGSNDAGEESSKDAGRRQQQAEWALEMRKASSRQGHVCWSSAYAGDSNCKPEEHVDSRLEQDERRHNSSIWRRLSYRLGIDKLRQKRAASDPLPLVDDAWGFRITKTVTHEREVSVPTAPAESVPETRKQSILSHFGRKG